MKVEKYIVSRDREHYEAWPDVVLDNGKLLCVFSECTHHCNRDYTRIMLTDSSDGGKTWTPRRPLTEGTRGLPYYYNCARIAKLHDGRLVVTVDRIPAHEREDAGGANVQLYFSADHALTWSGGIETPLHGIVPDKLTELDSGRWLLSAHRSCKGKLTQFIRHSDDGGVSWSEERILAHDPKLNLCEVSMLPLGNGVVAAFLRENSFLGLDCKKALSFDNGLTWGPVEDFPLPGCHRPTAGFLPDGRVLITYRFLQGGRSSSQNLFGALTDRKSVLAARSDASVRIFPIDYDRSQKPDIGYSGWAALDNGSVYIVNYIVDDAIDRGQIRGYSLRPEDFELSGDKNRQEEPTLLTETACGRGT